MHPLRALLPLCLLGCDAISASADGEWAGTCLFQGNYEDDWEAVDFEMWVNELDGRVKGEGEFTYDHHTFEGKVFGSRDEAFLELELEGSYNGHSTRLEVAGDIAGDRLSGWCSFYGVEGSLEMSR